MAYEQIPKQKIDIGQIGNPSTGDILYDGGDKLNGDLDAIYNMFGDQRFYNQGIDVGNQTIHATGYYQKVDQLEFRTPVPMGTMYDVDASAGSVNPILSKGKRGEGVIFVNFNGSISINRPLIIQASAGSFVNLPGPLTVTAPYSRVECWCISDENNVPVWNYKITSLFGQENVPINLTTSLTSTAKNIPIAHRTEFSSIKLFLTGMTADGTKMRQSELNILIDTTNNKVLNTEHAVLQTAYTEGSDELFTFDFDIDVAGVVNLVAKTTYPNVRLAIKSIATQRIGAA